MLQVNEVTARLDRLLAPDNQKILMHTLSSMDEAVTNFGNLPRQLEPALSSLQPLALESRKTLVSVNSMAENFSDLAKAMQGPNGTLARINTSLDQFNLTTGIIATSAGGLNEMTSSMNNDTLPRIGQLADDLGRSASGVDMTISNLGENPQSLIAGEPRIPPGPGEKGYRRE